MEAFFHEYGPIVVYIGIFLGALVEGESIVITAGILSYRYDSISLMALIGLAFAGSVLADQSLFFIGRKYGPGFIMRRPQWRAGVDRVFYHLKRHSTLFILSFRFIYGIRTLSPLVIGASGVPIKRFSSLNFIAAIFWATLSCSAGYYLGYLFEDQIDAFFEILSKYKRIIAACVLGIIAFIVGMWFYRQKRN